MQNVILFFFWCWLLTDEFEIHFDTTTDGHLWMSNYFHLNIAFMSPIQSDRSFSLFLHLECMFVWEHMNSFRRNNHDFSYCVVDYFVWNTTFLHWIYLTVFCDCQTLLNSKVHIFAFSFFVFILFLKTSRPILLFLKMM